MWPGVLRRREALFLGVAVLALLVRLIPLLAGGGLGFYNGYDDGVYYAAADALTFGHLPYRDFVLLHPPGIVVLLFPFAELGRLTSDATGMVVARCAFIALGALNTVLVAAIAARWSRRAALVAGVLYACWYPAVVTEQSTRLEPAGTALLLVGVLLLVRRRTPPTARDELLAGVALGLGAGFKIWGVAPWAVIVLWRLARRHWASAGRVVAGGAAALAVLLIPFFAVAPTRMFDMVVRDQFRRPSQRRSPALRLSSIFGVDSEKATHHIAIAVVVMVFVAAAVVVCLRDRTAWPILGLFGANLAVLLTSPTYFRHYAEFVAALAVLPIGIAAGRLATVPSAWRVRAFLPQAAAVALASASAVAVLAIPENVSLLSSRFVTDAPVGCLKSDDPGILIQMDRLSTDLQTRCPIGIDVWGTQHDSLFRVGAHGQALGPKKNPAWQEWLTNYLTSGNAFVVARRKDDALTPSTIARLDSYPLLAESHGAVLRSG